LADVLGFDIGGANTKAALLHTKNGRLVASKVALEYFPIWKEPAKLSSVLLSLGQRLGAGHLDGLGVTMTAELSDAYATKREGVTQILSCVKQTYPDVPIHVLDTDGNLASVDEAEAAPFKVAAANWAATGWLVAQRIRDCVVVDVGSTSASIVPIVNGRVVARGKTDLEKLMFGELVYTGCLRTNVCAIVQSIPLRGGVAKVASELFATSGDVHLLLGNIAASQYVSETADGRGKTVAEASARLARTVCADTEMLTHREIVQMATYIYERQVAQVAEGLGAVNDNMKKLAGRDVSVAVTGLGRDFLARKAAEKVGVDSIVDLATLLETEAVSATPAFAVALMAACKVEGGNVQWTRQ